MPRAGRTDLQERKLSRTGGLNVRDRRGVKRALDEFCGLVRGRQPYCEISYAF